MIPSRHTSAAIDEQAAKWAVILDGTPLADEDRAAFDEWLAHDSRHLGALARAQAVIASCRRAETRAAPNHLSGLPMTGSSAIVSDEGRAAEPEFDAPPFDRARRRFMLGGAAAAAVTAAVVTTALWCWPAEERTYRTKRGETRLIALDDGSSITLDTETEIVVAFDRSQRNVRLLDGEALFDVAKDPDRPFVVAADYARVRAIGTSFAVRNLGAEQIEVVVRHGIVELTPPEEFPAVSRRLGANTFATMSRRGEITAVALNPAEIAALLAWREGMLSFGDVPLADAAKEFARYSGFTIRFVDAAVAAERVTGRFAANDPAGFCSAVAHTFGLRVRHAPGEATLYR